MSNVRALLPPSSSGAFEKAIAAGMSDDLPVPYAELLNPYTTRPDLLKWLGFQASLDLWFDDWPIERQREAIAQAMGVSTLFDGELAALKTTRGGAIRYLALVDAELVDAVSYPALAIIDEGFFDEMILDHPPFLTTYLVKIETAEPETAFIDGFFLDDGFFGEIITEPYDRTLKALRAAKGGDHTELLVDFQNARVLTAGDAVLAGDAYLAGQYLTRTKL